MDTRFSTLSYIKLKRLDNDIKTKSITKTCTNYETIGKPRKKSHIPVSNPNLTKSRCAWSGTVQRRYHSATMPSISEVLFLVQYKWTGQVGCVKTTTRNFVKLQKYAFLKQNNFMRIDELPYHSSLFYKLNFVSRRQFFINIGKYPSKMQKVRNDPFLGNRIFKRRALFSD